MGGNVKLRTQMFALLLLGASESQAAQGDLPAVASINVIASGDAIVGTFVVSFHAPARVWASDRWGIAPATGDWFRVRFHSERGSFTLCREGVVPEWPHPADVKVVGAGDRLQQSFRLAEDSEYCLLDASNQRVRSLPPGSYEVDASFAVEDGPPAKRCGLTIFGVAAHATLIVPEPSSAGPQTGPTLASLFEGCLMGSKAFLQLDALPPASVGPAPIVPANVDELDRDVGWSYQLSVFEPLELSQLQESAGKERLLRLDDATFMDVKFRLRCSQPDRRPVELLVAADGMVFSRNRFFRLRSGRNWLKDFIYSLGLLQFPG